MTQTSTHKTGIAAEIRLKSDLPTNCAEQHRSSVEQQIGTRSRTGEESLSKCGIDFGEASFFVFQGLDSFQTEEKKWVGAVEEHFQPGSRRGVSLLSLAQFKSRVKTPRGSAGHNHTVIMSPYAWINVRHCSSVQTLIGAWCSRHPPRRSS